jgi:hypothetical protein
LVRDLRRPGAVNLKGVILKRETAALVRFTVVFGGKQGSKVEISSHRRSMRPLAWGASCGNKLAAQGFRDMAELGFIQGFPGLTVVDSICPATRERQEALGELCSRVDALVIAGGRSSSNARRLLDIALSLGKPAWLVENAAETGALSAGLAGFKTIGLSAGASTPDSDIAGIEAALAGL